MEAIKCPFCGRDIKIEEIEYDGETMYTLKHINEMFDFGGKVYMCPIAHYTYDGLGEEAILGGVYYDSLEEIKEVWENITPVEITFEEDIEDYWDELEWEEERKKEKEAFEKETK